MKMVFILLNSFVIDWSLFANRSDLFMEGRPKNNIRVSSDK